MKIDPLKLKLLVKGTVAEDVRDGDITTINLIPPTNRASARIVSRDHGIVCGLGVARQVFKTLDKNCVWRSKYSDGDVVKSGRTVATVSGLSRAILTGERTALNFLSRLSGIATLTRKYADRVSKKNVGIYDTRKTSPGLRFIEKYAVAVGGGSNHRMALDEMILIKENHIKVCKRGNIPLAQALTAIKGKIPRGMQVEIEAQNIRQVEFALKNKVNIIMLDNLDFNTLRRAVEIIRKSGKKTEIEVSGGVNLKNVERIARLGVERISVGALTHSAPAVDFSLDII